MRRFGCGWFDLHVIPLREIAPSTGSPAQTAFRPSIRPGPSRARRWKHRLAWLAARGVES